VLEALAGVRPADSGTLAFDGVDVYCNLAATPCRGTERAV